MASSLNYPNCVVLLLKNPKTEFLKAANLLVKIAQNIQQNPNVEKYKSIKVGGRTFMESLLPIDGAVQCLLEMGFIEFDDIYVFLDESTSEKLESLKIGLEKAIQATQNSDKDNNRPSTSKTRGSSGKSLLASERKTYQRINSNFEHVLVYENRILQQKARSVIPMEILARKANDRLAENPEFSSNKGKIPLKYDDCIVLELLHWFKYDFFKWMDAPKCENCTESKSIPIGMLNPTSIERKWGASTVEGYVCNKCGCRLRYPRYNHPEKLLETRSGRCGEWANCFTFLCRSLGYETRHISDWTDHVWTEVYSESAGRWVHCDPCENVFDQPLMYEQGWGKKLSLIVAASCDETADVTWRYSNKAEELKSRRSEMFRESWLQGTLHNITRRRQVWLSPQRKHEIDKRMITEMVEFISPKIKSSIVYKGRMTGSLEWRKARGELGEDVEKKLVVPQLGNENQGTIRLEYFSASDKYITEQTPDGISGWKTFVHSFSCVQRTVEEDWQMVYLSRTPSSKSGTICWKFDLSDSGQNVVVKSLNIKVQSTTFQSGKISWLLCTEKSTHAIQSGKTHSFGEEVLGCHVLSLHAFLSGGDGEVAWQHTQLFRERLDKPSNEPQFDVTIEYEKEQ